MQESPLGITDTSKTLCVTLLEQHQAYPEHTLFRDDIFDSTCQNIRTRNEDRVIQYITRLIVPSAESLAKFSARDTDILIESVNEGWNNSIPLTKTRPQPDYSVGFKRAALTESQLARLSPFIGDYLSGDQSFFMSTYYMFFPFLTCEVKCGGSLDIADRQNAHSTTLAARGVVELFRAVQRGDEVSRQILAFSISHDQNSVRIHGQYAVVEEGKDTKYYRHPIRKFDFMELNGRDRWAAYQFTKDVY
ncbi:hypothetical protein CPLU01_13072 [Colletotrichum plurivorum]|uniref:DUF7924 domain-containing protein n=1 Tax=Colletotrichum plurivorum TaxID=2175906 RepID=A0A8H6JTW7_9PEZI|nr:hypothetical protein CPLU01_13072 [Colletotrichum plurivorum]